MTLHNHVKEYDNVVIIFRVMSIFNCIGILISCCLFYGFRCLSSVHIFVIVFLLVILTVITVSSFDTWVSSFDTWGLPAEMNLELSNHLVLLILGLLAVLSGLV